MELLRENDLNSIHSFYQQLNDSDEKEYVLFHPTFSAISTVSKCSNCGREKRARKDCKQQRNFSSWHTIGCGMRSSWTCCLLLLYHELLMPATFPPFGSLHTDFLLSILLLYITSYFTSIQKSAKIVHPQSRGRPPFIEIHYNCRYVYGFRKRNPKSVPFYHYLQRRCASHQGTRRQS